MRTSTCPYLALAVLAAVLFSGCGTKAKPVDLREVPISISSYDSNCAEPKPANLGCELPCSSCLTSTCLGAEWVPIQLPEPEFCAREETPRLCRIPRKPGEKLSKRCPAGCDICF